ncbi:hypothetical protein [Arthrobacter sp. JCM 19049]|uniref:hypothetical protein n=1 Tax=Arthrobacter sp. JCM 19049 TaxID=1460643 RepID=UPI0006D143E2|nr:hypothetical protein [Arthrobacter sp. JCM 19049]
MTTILCAVAVLLTLGYTTLNGFRDASTAVAAAVRTRALTPGIAVTVAAIFAFLGTLASSSFGFSWLTAWMSACPRATLD